MKPQLSIIIVHYQNQKALKTCLNSIKKYPPKCSYEIIISDNHPQPGLKLPQLKKIIYIPNKKNLGFAKANNQAAKKAKGKYLLFLNPDTQVLKNSINQLLKFIKTDPKTAAVAPLLLNSKRQPYLKQGTSILTPLKAVLALSFIDKLWPQNPVSRSYWQFFSKPLPQKPVKVDVLPGSAFLIKKTVFQKLKGFDTRFFLYFEESDLFKRLKNLNLNCFILPTAKIIHYWGGSTPQTKKIQKIFQTSRFQYFKKHFSLFKALIVELFTRLSPHTFGLSLILILTLFLRFYKLSTTVTFTADQGQNYLAARDLILNHKIPSLSRFFPIFFIALALKLYSFNPLGPVILMSLLSLLTVYLTFILASRWFSKSVALIMALIMACFSNAFILNRFFTPSPTLNQQLKAVKLIKSQTQNHTFQLINTPLNYQYLIWWLGLKPSADPDYIYTIFEGPDNQFIPPPGTTTFHFDKLKLIRYD